MSVSLVPHKEFETPVKGRRVGDWHDVWFTKQESLFCISSQVLIFALSKHSQDFSVKTSLLVFTTTIHRFYPEVEET